jgi:competence protein ComEC
MLYSDIDEKQPECKQRRMGESLKIRRKIPLSGAELVHAGLLRLKTYFYTQIYLQTGRLFYWSPVFLSLGIILYFSLPFEPSFWPALLAVPISLFSLFGLRKNRLWFILTLCLIVLPSCGFFLSKLHVMCIHTPMINKEIGPVTITGTLKALEIMKPDYDARIILEDLSIEDLAQNDTPKAVRLRLRRDYGLNVGQRISALAELTPVSGPAMPGGFDFRRHLYFQGIGAVGFIYSHVEILEESRPKGFSQYIESLRSTIGARVHAALPKNLADMVTALTNGQRAGISEADQNAMRYSGLAHLLAISGLHVGLVCGVVFFMIRLTLSFIPGLALKWPIKKIAAILALLAGIIYMFLAGATVPTQRAALMCGVVFTAIIFDRSPFSLRLVVFAALVVLCIAPFSLLTASFQLSFAAVASLIAVYDALRQYYRTLAAQSGWFKKIMLYIGGVSFTSIIAGFATALFSLYHFQQFANYGILANMLAIPVMAFWVMPLIVLSLIAMPFGLEALPLHFCGYGVGWILETAHFVSGLDGAVFRMRLFNLPAFCLGSAALVGLIFLKGHFRVICCIMALLIAPSIFIQKQPDILISSSHDLIALHQDDRLLVNTKRKDKFTRENWESASGLTPDSAVTWVKEAPEQCDDLGCRTTLKGVNIAYSLNPYGLREDCGWADIVISDQPVQTPCAAKIIIDKFDTYYRGAHSVFIKDGDIEILNVRDTSNNNRPWSTQYK